MVLDTLVTRWGIWVYKLTEGNPVYNLFGTKIKNFLFNTAFGTFLDGGVKLIGAGFIAKLFYDHGFGHADGSYWDSLIMGIPALAILGIVLRNALLIKKLPHQK
jgi:hypothetical protein